MRHALDAEGSPHSQQMRTVGRQGIWADVGYGQRWDSGGFGRWGDEGYEPQAPEPQAPGPTASARNWPSYDQPTGSTSPLMSGDSIDSANA